MTTKGAKKKTIWQKYVAYMRKKNPDKPLKVLLRTYSKAEYAKFKANPKSFLGDE